MGTAKTMQLVVTPQTKLNNGTGLTAVALFTAAGAPVTIPSAAVNATTSVKGLVNQAAAQANSTATDVPGLVADFNALLAKLRTAGILAP